MIRSIFLSLIVMAAIGVTGRSQAQAPAPAVILKLDDMKHRNGVLTPGWQQTLAYLDEQAIPASIGVVGNTLEDAPAAYLDALKALDATGRYELWNHGWSHTRDQEAGTWEFRGTGYEYQRERFARTQRLAREKLGVDFVGFGAPYNQTDDDTVRVLAEHRELRWWMYPPRDAEAPAGVVVLPRISKVNIEMPVQVPNPEALAAAFPAYRHESVLVIQGHPMSWEQDGRFEKFVAVIEFLQQQGCRFVLPSDYVAETNRSTLRVD